MVNSEKVCSKCLKTKCTDQFGIDQHKADGLRGTCKQCRIPIARAADSRKRQNPKHKQRIIKYAAEWQKANPEKMRVYYRRYRESNAQKRKAGIADWAKRNSDKVAQKAHRYRSRKNNAFVENVAKHELLDKYGNFCYICSAPFTSADPMAVEHLIPLSKGGEHAMVNLRPAHRSCNSRKGVRVVSFFEALNATT